MMKNKPIFLTLLCASLIWYSESNAMDELLVLDRKVENGRNKILVLTETGLSKATSLQNFYDQQPEKKRINLTEILNSTETGYDDDLNHVLEESEFEEAIRLSLLEGQSSETTPFSGPFGTTLQTLEPSDLPHPNLTKEEDDPSLNLALSSSFQEYEMQQRKIADEKEFAEKKQIEERRAEARKELEEVREIRSVQKDSLFSRINELINERTLLSEENVIENTELTEEKEQNKKLRQEKLDRLYEMVNSLFNEMELFRLLDSQIHEEILHLMQGGNPRDLPWKQELSLTQQGGATPLSPSLQGSFPEILSSALPNLNNESPKGSDSLDKL